MGQMSGSLPLAAEPVSLRSQGRPMSGEYARPEPQEVLLAERREQMTLHQPHAKPGPYVTQLSPEDEQSFRGWVSENRVPFDPADPAADYDMRAYWRDVASKGASETAVNPDDQQVHYPDTYKTPYHQSFSAESEYAEPGAPVWINDHQLADPVTGHVVYDERAVAARPARYGDEQ